MGNVIIFGTGKHAKVVIDAIEKEGKYKILGLVGGFKEPGEIFYGYKVLGSEEDLGSIGNHVHGGIVAIGDNWVRSEIVEKIKKYKPDFHFITVIHPFSSIARGVTMGKGTVIMSGAVINSDTIIGEHCIINTKASVDHDCRVNDFVTISPGATIAGNVNIDDYSVIALSASVSNSKKIGKHSVIGASSLVLVDIGPNVIAYGIPARIIRSRNIGEKYF